jgi:hypothetical protein
VRSEKGEVKSENNDTAESNGEGKSEKIKQRHFRNKVRRES